MTIAIGVLCKEGAVLLTDSMTIANRGDRMEGFLTTEGKVRVLPEAGLAYVHSGARTENYRVPAISGGFVESARALFASIVAASPRVEAIPTAYLRTRDGSAPGKEELARRAAQELVVASLDQNQAPALGFLHLDGERWLDQPGLVIAGAPIKWGQETGAERLPVPDDLEAAVALAVTLGRDFLNFHYGARSIHDFAAEGLIPPIAYPLQITDISKSGTVQQRHWLPSWEEYNS